MKKVLVILTVLILTATVASAESLFSLGATQNYVGSPKPLYGGVQARNVGDLITIILNETIKTQDQGTFNSDRSSETVDGFTKFLNDIFHISWFKDASNYGGSNAVASSTTQNRQMAFQDSVAVQVIQQTPNGNLLVQGKKVVVNGNERMDVIITGMVDPRWITASGTVESTHVANLQFAFAGRGAVSRGQSEGVINRVIRYLF